VSASLDPLLLEHFVLPLLAQLRDWRQQADQGRHRLPLIGLNGPVGAGKSTLGRQLEALAPRFGLRLVVASIDDLYLSWPERGERLAGNPFGVSRVPPGSHDLPLLLQALAGWRAGEPLRLPRFDKRLAGGEGDRCGWHEQPCDALVLEGWLLGCRPLDSDHLNGLVAAATAPQRLGPEVSEPSPLTVAGGGGAPALNRQEWLWLPRWNRELETYLPLWQMMDALWILRPLHWALPRRWRFQAEARQRRAGGGWLPPRQLSQLVRASLCSLPPSLYQDPLIESLPDGALTTWDPQALGHGPKPGGLMREESRSGTVMVEQRAACQAAHRHEQGVHDNGGQQPPIGAVAWLDGRRRCRRAWLQSSPSASSSATG